MKKLFVLMLMTTILYTGYNFLQDDTVYHYEQITVHTGDTMWAIADRWALMLYQLSYCRINISKVMP